MLAQRPAFGNVFLKNMDKFVACLKHFVLQIFPIAKS